MCLKEIQILVVSFPSAIPQEFASRCPLNMHLSKLRSLGGLQSFVWSRMGYTLQNDTFR